MIHQLPYFFNIGAPSPDELREIQRQNKITAQILENFLERRLFPNKRPTHKLPTLHDILPKSIVDTKSTPSEHGDPIKRHNYYNNDADSEDVEYQDLDRDPESLQSVESEHVDSYYDDFLAIKQGRCHLGLIFFSFKNYSLFELYHTEKITGGTVRR